MINEITVNELKALQDAGTDNLILIDVREPHEVDIATIGGTLIPVGDVPSNINEFDFEDKKVVVYCRSGKRSANAIHFLQEQGIENLFNLKGGILEWADQIDPSLEKY